jgi:hypothetical protein
MIVCEHCERSIVYEDWWVDPEATGDDSIWRETCDANDTFTAEHEPRADEPLDVWLRTPDGEEEAEAEANTFYDDGVYRVDWSLTSVGLVKSATFSTYDQARQWLVAEGFGDFAS